MHIDSATTTASITLNETSTNTASTPSKENSFVDDSQNYTGNYRDNLKKENAEIALKNLQNEEFELLGMLLLKEGKVIPQISAKLKADDFYLPLHRKIYQSIVDVYVSGNVPSMITIVNDFQAKGILLTTADYSYIFDLGRVAFTTAYAEDYAKDVKENSIRRQLETISKNLNKHSKNATVDVSELLSALESETQKLGTDWTVQADVECTTFYDYFNNGFDADVATFRQYAGRKTGFENLDEKQIFVPGIYVIGAMPAIGKTTFAWQLLNQLADNGEKCIYLSFEMSKAALFAKSVSQEVFKLDEKSTLSATDIRIGGNSLTSRQVVKKFKERGNGLDLTVIQCAGKNIDECLRILRRFKCGDKPLTVCLDYLQIIPPTSTDKNITDKQKVDDILFKLKKFQQANNATIIIISSFNRAHYRVGVSLESFKESGGIEYYVDVAYGLEPQPGNDFNVFMRMKPRPINLVCLKNRYGALYDVQFNYYSRFDYFEPCDDEEIAEPPKKTWTANEVFGDCDDEF